MVEYYGTDQHVSTRALSRDLHTYPRLMEALPSIEVDFFRSPLCDEEKRDIVQSSPRTVGVIYTPPRINYSATAPIKKLDTAYYIVQAFLAQATRPVDYYVHQLLQDEPETPTNDSRFLFASTMRLLLSEVCTLLTQARLDNLHSELNLPESPPQLNPSISEPLIDPALLSELMATKKPTNLGGKKPFRGRHQQAASQAAPKTVTIAATAPVTNQNNLADGSNQQFANYKGGFRGGRGGYATSRYRLHQFQEAWGWLTSDFWLQETIANGTIVQKGNRKGIPAITGILLEYIHGSKRIRGASSSSRHETTEQTPEENTLQNGISDVHRKYDPQEGLLVINLPCRCLSAHPYKDFVQEVLALSMERERIPVPGSNIWDVPITAGFYQNPPSSNKKGSPARDQNFRLPGRPPDNGLVKRRIFEIRNVYFEKTGPTWYEDQHQVHDASGTRKQDQLYKGQPKIDIDSHNNAASIKESGQVEGPTVSINEPGRCAIEDDCPDRSVDLSCRLQGNTGPFRKQRHRYIRVCKKHATEKILQLVSRQGSRGNRRLYAAMVSMKERVLLPTVVPTVAIGNVVSRTNEVSNPPTNILTGNSGGARPQKRQVAFDEEQVLVFNSLAHKRRALLDQGLEDQAIEIILSNPRTDKRMRNYDHTQKHSLAWRIDQGIIRPINAADIVNFLAKSYVEDKLALSTIKAYKSALMHLYKAYKSYILHVKDVQCMRKHDNQPDTILSMFLRHIRDYTKPLSVDSISRHVHMLSYLIVRPPNTPRLKTRALGPTLAAAAGVPSSDIVAQAFWSNYYMFENYYRLSRSTSSNITESVLPLE
ncbi:hypothetical protein AYI69_g7543 [Smittium culicis]|uniref:Core-binding (CB) domain-containing protein n=1 Tax=Smittium culicis TaxID=133412 RepID=A0A1R1XR66_9FUNG|nr:hypothetical protein AYI69_g7543 [Smittium culicis]